MKKLPLLLLFIGLLAQPIWASDSADELKKAFDAVLEELNTKDLDVRITRDTGMVWGLVQSVVEPKSGGRITQLTRLTVTFVKREGNWKILNWHGSLPPQRQGMGTSEQD